MGKNRRIEKQKWSSRENNEKWRKEECENMGKRKEMTFKRNDDLKMAILNYKIDEIEKVWNSGVFFLGRNGITKKKKDFVLNLNNKRT